MTNGLYDASRTPLSRMNYFWIAFSIFSMPLQQLFLCIANLDR
jgi:hypothetical protein